MTANTIPQGDLALIDDPIAQELLASSIPARVGYIATDGTPRVTPMWFTWNGTELVLGAAGTSPKVAALRANPRVAITIDSDTAPYRILSIRGDATITTIDGAVDEYADAVIRYMGLTHGSQFREHARATMKNMARISIKPDWVSLIDFQARFPSSY